MTTTAAREGAARRDPVGLPGPVSETRRKVLLATADLIERHSYRSVTIDAIARAAGVSKATIYRHWPSRQRLLLEAYADRTDRLIFVEDTGDAIADLRTYLGKLAYCLRLGGAASTVAGLIADAVHDDDLASAFRDTVIRGRRREFLAILLRGQQRGQLRVDVDLATVVDALYGAVHHRLIVTGQPIDDHFVAALVDLVQGGLRPSSPAVPVVRTPPLRAAPRSARPGSGPRPS